MIKMVQQNKTFFFCKDQNFKQMAGSADQHNLHTLGIIKLSATC